MHSISKCKGKDCASNADILGNAIMMFFVRMIRLVPLVVILLLLGFIIYIIAQIKYSPNKAKAIVIKLFIWICSILTIFFLLCCLYAVLDANNIPALELFLSFATVPAVGLLITLLCKLIFNKNHPDFKLEAAKTNKNLSFKEFWKEKIIKVINNWLYNNFKK